MSQPHKICPVCRTPADLQAPQCAHCGRVYRTQFPQNPDRTVLGSTPADPGYQPPPQAAPYPPPPPAPAYQPAPPVPGPPYPPHAATIGSAYPSGYTPTTPPYQQPHNPHVHVHLNQPAAPPVMYAFQPVRQIDACAWVSLIFGIAGVMLFCFFGWIFGLVGMAVGIASISRIRRRPELDGMPLAIGGILLSAIPVLWYLALMMTIMSAIGSTPSQPPPTPGVSSPTPVLQ